MSAEIICPVNDGWSVCWYHADGHLEPATFIAALTEEQGVTCSPEKVRHTYLRSVPAKKWSDFDFMYLPCQKGRGAKAVTMVDREDTRDAPHAEGQEVEE